MILRPKNEFKTKGKNEFKTKGSSVVANFPDTASVLEEDNEA